MNQVDNSMEREMRTTRAMFVLLAVLATAPATEAAGCNQAFVNSVLSRMNTLVSGSGSCRKMLGADNAQIGKVCTTCRGTISRLLTLRSMYSKNTNCFRNDPKISARFNELWYLKKDVDKLQRMCS
jgi:hypothetical protein